MLKNIAISVAILAILCNINNNPGRNWQCRQRTWIDPPGVTGVGDARWSELQTCYTTWGVPPLDKIKTMFELEQERNTKVISKNGIMWICISSLRDRFFETCVTVVTRK